MKEYRNLPGQHVKKHGWEARDFSHVRLHVRLIAEKEYFGEVLEKETI